MKALTYFVDGKPQLTWPGTYIDENGEEQSFLNQLIEELPEGVSYELLNEEEVESWLISNSLMSENSEDIVSNNFDEIDMKSIRAIRAILTGRGTDEDMRVLSELEDEVESKRQI